MSQWFEVTLTCTATVVVEVCDDEGRADAERYASEDSTRSGWHFESSDARPITGDALAAAKRHADEVLPL